MVRVVRVAAPLRLERLRPQVSHTVQGGVWGEGGWGYEGLGVIARRDESWQEGPRRTRLQGCGEAGQGGGLNKGCPSAAVQVLQ